MPDALSTYAFLNAKLRARISNLLPSDKVDELLRAKSLSEAVALLKGTAFEPLEAVFAQTGDLRGAESLLYSMEVELYTGLLHFAREPVLSLLRALATRYEVDTLKNALRLWFDSRVRGRRTDGSSVYLYRGHIVNRLNLDAILASSSVDDLVLALKGTPYENIVRENGSKVESGKSLFPLETALDRHYYSMLLETFSDLDPRDRKIAERMLGVEIDIYNIEWIIRAQSFYHLSLEDALSYLIPHGTPLESPDIAAAYGAGNVSALLSELLKKKYGRFQALVAKGGDQPSRLVFMEQTLRQIMRWEADRLLLGYPFTIGIALAYFALKREEIRTVLAILNAKYYMLSEERIKNSL